MREIKFRAWYDQKELMYSDEYSVLEHFFAWSYHWKPEHLMQYTGLKDKNGKEIYEGDIVKCNPSYKENHEIGTIAWEKRRGGFVVKVGRPTSQGFDALKMAGATHKEIVGNIYENPELLD